MAVPGPDPGLSRPSQSSEARRSSHHDHRACSHPRRHGRLVPAIPIAWSAELLFIGITALDTLSRHGRACPGHPDQTSAALQSIGITGTGPVMTWERSERRGAFRIGITGTGPRIESGEMMKGDAIFRHSPYRHSRLYGAAGPARAAPLHETLTAPLPRSGLHMRPSAARRGSGHVAAAQDDRTSVRGTLCGA
jgi:hypothetical protein